MCVMKDIHLAVQGHLDALSAAHVDPNPLAPAVVFLDDLQQFLPPEDQFPRLGGQGEGQVGWGGVEKDILPRVIVPLYPSSLGERRSDFPTGVLPVKAE